MITLVRPPKHPLSPRFASAERALARAQRRLDELLLLEAARLVRSPFPDATELVVDVATDDGSVGLVSVHCGPDVLYTTGLAGEQADPVAVSRLRRCWRTLDGARLHDVERAIESALTRLLRRRDPLTVWTVAAPPDQFRVPLPSPESVESRLA